MSFKDISYEVSNRVLTITLNRPESLNAFTVNMAEELISAFQRASEDGDVGAIVVTGSGNVFCAGMDLSVDGNVFGLNEALDPSISDLEKNIESQEYLNGVRDSGGRVALAIFECTKPVVCAINGAAVGVGITMTLPMDIRLSSEQAKFGFVFNKIGIVPEACSTWFLPKIVGLSKALEWTYSAEIFGAEEAKRHGLIQDYFPINSLLDRAYDIANKLAKMSSTSIMLTRQMMYRNSSYSHPLEAHKIESLSMLHTSKNSGKEGICSFLQKRTPNFSEENNSLPSFYPWWN